MGTRDWHEEARQGFRRQPDGALDDEERAALDMRRHLRMVPRYRTDPPPGFEPSLPPLPRWRKLLRRCRRWLMPG
jgi:hypothetical protein